MDFHRKDRILFLHALDFMGNTLRTVAITHASRFVAMEPLLCHSACGGQSQGMVKRQVHEAFCLFWGTFISAGVPLLLACVVLTGSCGPQGGGGGRSAA